MDPDKALLAEVFKLLGNSVFSKLIEEVERRKKVTFTKAESTVDEALLSVWFLNLSKVGDAFDIETRKDKITIDRPFQVGIVVYQLAKLCVLEFDYDFLDKFVDQKDFELLQMETDSLYFRLSAKKLEDVIRPKLQEGFEACKQNWLAWGKWRGRGWGLEGTRGIFILWRMRKQSKPSPLKRGFKTTKAAKPGKVRGFPGRG